MKEELKEELAILNLLRNLFLEEPGRDLVEKIGKIKLPLEEDEESKSLRSMIEAVKKNEGRLDEWLAELAQEFTRLFIGPTHPPAIPFASFYLSQNRLLMTADTLEVRKRYLEAGMVLKDLYSIPDDHIAFELEFIYSLTKDALERWEKGEEKERDRLLKMREEFLLEHMALWVPALTARILESSEEDFYREAAMILQEVIKVYQAAR